MIKKVIKEIQKLEQQKKLKTQKKNDLEKELSEIDSKLKELNLINNQYNKIKMNINEFFDTEKNQD